jgi:hypothetical protein
MEEVKMELKALPIKGEGWDVFESMEHGIHIERVDSPDTVNGVVPPLECEAYHLLPAFDDDEEAVRHVITCAKLGDQKCLDALWEVLDDDDLVNRILWEDALGCVVTG